MKGLLYLYKFLILIRLWDFKLLLFVISIQNRSKSTYSRNRELIDNDRTPQHPHFSQYSTRPTSAFKKLNGALFASVINVSANLNIQLTVFSIFVEAYALIKQPIYEHLLLWKHLILGGLIVSCRIDTVGYVLCLSTDPVIWQNECTKSFNISIVKVILLVCLVTVKQFKYKPNTKNNLHLKFFCLDVSMFAQAITALIKFVWIFRFISNLPSYATGAYYNNWTRVCRNPK